MKNRDDRLAYYDEQTRVSGFVYVVMMVVAAAFAGLVWSIYVDAGPPERISAPNAPYKISPEQLESAAADAGDLSEAVRLGPANAEAAPTERAATPAEAPSAQPNAAPNMPVFTANGGFVAQVAALQSEDAVDAAWRRLSSRSPNLFGPATLDVERADLGARGIYYRVRAGYFGERAQAEHFCERVERLGQDCIVTRR